MFKLINKWFNKLAKKWLTKNAPPGEHLAYINDDEAKLLKKHGGAGVEWGDTGIKTYFIHRKKHRKKISNWFKNKVFKPLAKGFGKIVSSIGSMFGLGGMFNAPDLGSISSAAAANEGILLNQTGTLHNIPVIYGQRKVGGTVVFMGTEGDRNQNLYMAVVLSEGEIEGVDQIFLDGIPYTDSRFSGLQRVDVFHGGENQGASDILKQATGWTDDHRLRGVAYLACKFEMPEIKSQEDSDKNPWQGIPRVQAVVRGKKVASAATAGTSDYATETAAATTTSNNPADILLDYMRNPRYGRGLANNRIDFDAFAKARTSFNFNVEFKDGSSSALHQVNAVINTGDTVLNNIKKLLVHCRSAMPYVQGKFWLTPLDTGSETSPVDPNPVSDFDITENHIVDGIEIVDPGTRNQPNQVRVSYIDPNKSGSQEDWSSNEVIYPALNSERDVAMLAEDGGRRVIKEYNLEYCTNENLAAYHAKLLCENERRIKILSIKCTAELHQIRVGAIVRVSYPPLGLNNAFYRVMNWELTETYEINLQLREHEPATYEYPQSNAIMYGTNKQRQYVGDTQRVTSYYFNPATGTYDIANKPFDENESSLPNINIGNIDPDKLRITASTVLGSYDNPSAAYQTNEFTLTIADEVIDAAQSIQLQVYDRVIDMYQGLTSINPGVHRVSPGVYKVKANLEMNGIQQRFKLVAYINGKVFKSGNFDFIPANTIYKKVIEAVLA